MKHRSHTAAGLIKSTTSVSIFTPLNTTTLLQKQTLLSQKHRLYRRRILPYQKYHLFTSPVSSFLESLPVSPDSSFESSLSASPLSEVSSFFSSEVSLDSFESSFLSSSTSGALFASSVSFFLSPSGTSALFSSFVFGSSGVVSSAGVCSGVVYSLGWGGERSRLGGLRRR